MGAVVFNRTSAQLNWASGFYSEADFTTLVEATDLLSQLRQHHQEEIGAAREHIEDRAEAAFAQAHAQAIAQVDAAVTDLRHKVDDLRREIKTHVHTCLGKVFDNIPDNKFLADLILPVVNNVCEEPHVQICVHPTVMSLVESYVNDDDASRLSGAVELIASEDMTPRAIKIVTDMRVYEVDQQIILDSLVDELWS
ncbi:hypothetical protein [uncultured Tateyamaria sp.]|uniref:hypothetical protein n=1 Tax=uncultured Tateyamaria sp. TaxID=455651 RepID=UPI0026127900|nr:hypothetical protein [uncultured Tateyamaria sp.]